MCKSSANVEGTCNFAIKLFGATISVCVRDESSQEENNARKRPAQAEMATNPSKSLKMMENLHQKGENICNLRDKGAKSLENFQEKSESLCNISDRGAKSLKKPENCEEKSEISCNIEASEQKAPPKPEKPVACPRCHSLETKFCYFNNYNVNQPRHFCKNCRRYWTAGGSMRNIPVGAGRRKSKHFTAFHLSKSMDLQDQKMKLENFDESIEAKNSEIEGSDSVGFVNPDGISAVSATGIVNLLDQNSTPWIPKIQQNVTSNNFLNCLVLHGRPFSTKLHSK
ncbi:hypothetical protein SUGI_0642650 [Cryptomeria japonica]|uniref:dof zinc finger protein DOF1.7 n=1 Tax=Cryptomeria japonica TaxID=3369 RepID=UPI0024146FFD|nr:dof zinc finger protein DOF1.7 [Cryptomeria japonica]GLJ31929.1 hypothetical protein SUGI_0642650 [Cryptomeria japonica]